MLNILLTVLFSLEVLNVVLTTNDLRNQIINSFTLTKVKIPFISFTVCYVSIMLTYYVIILIQ